MKSVTLVFTDVEIIILSRALIIFNKIMSVLLKCTEKENSDVLKLTKRIGVIYHEMGLCKDKDCDFMNKLNIKNK